MRALILDLDFTLLHLKAVPGAIEVPGRTRSAWVAPRTIELLDELQSDFDLVLATARSLGGTRPVVDGLRERGVAVAGLVLEDGALWGEAHLAPFDAALDVAGWRARLEHLALPPFEWQLDFSACAVARCDGRDDAARLLEGWSSAFPSTGARFFRDGRKVYALPKRADKWSALERLLGERAAQAAGAGDGANDLVWLPRVANPATFAGANSALVEEVRAAKGFVCGREGHDGIAEILTHFAVRSKA